MDGAPSGALEKGRTNVPVLADDGSAVAVSIGATEVLRYVYRPDMHRRHSPRPYLHPVRTLAGQVVTETAPADHPWHYGISLAIPLLSGVNFWGGPTFVRDDGYVELDDHGTVQHLEWLPTVGDDGTARLDQRLAWVDASGTELLHERRRMAVRRTDAAVAGWSLAVDSALTNVADRDLEIGSPPSSARPGGGYGG
jgi:hypothetical protein